MTDNEIIKALECCNDGACEYCPFAGNDCIQKSRKEAIDFITRQKAEIERLKVRNDELNALNKTASIDAIREFAKKHREIIMAFCDDDDQISLKVCEYDANTDNLVKEMVGDS